MQLTSFTCENANLPPKVSSEDDKKEEKEEEKEDLHHVIGGSSNADLDSDTVKEAVSFSVGKFNSETNGLYAVELNNVMSATTQIVSGVLVKARILATLVSCTDLGEAVNQCESNKYFREAVECDVEVWDQPWRTPRHVLMKHHCEPAVMKDVKPDNALRFVPGGAGEGIFGAREYDDRERFETRPLIGYSLSHFQDFKTKFGRKYASKEEELKRYNQFRKNMQMAQFIQDHDLGDATYGATMFADFTPEEFQAYVSKTWDKNAFKNLKPAVIPNVEPPKEFDWRQHNVVTPVKNQGSCGSCWAFCVTGNIEGQWAIKKSQLVNLSEQQLVDCDKIDEGCNGGLPSQAYEEILRMGGLETEEDYPYKGIDDQCKFSAEKIKVYINGSDRKSVV